MRAAQCANWLWHVTSAAKYWRTFTRGRVRSASRERNGGTWSRPTHPGSRTLESSNCRLAGSAGPRRTCGDLRLLHSHAHTSAALRYIEPMTPADVRNRFRGVFGFPITPFHKDLSLDLDALGRNVDEMSRHP